ncbi:MAG: hypothetical protein ACODAJ_14720 [Planctomycetota bacterium]
MVTACRLVAVALAAVLLGCACLAAEPAVTAHADSPMLRFAAEEVRTALRERGETARVLIGTFASFPGGAAKEPPAAAEAYTIGRPSGTVVVAGHDERGAMYGALEAAELIRTGGIAAVSAAVGKPFLEVRQFKYNIPGVRDQAWFHDEAYWRSFFGLLARARFNAIGFWHQHPFPYMVRLEQFPEAAVLEPEAMTRNTKTFQMIFRLARERGIATYLINWNIHLPAGFAKKHGLKAEGEDAPVVRRYMRACVAETLRTYPDLTGLGLCAGERMPSDDYDWREQWIKETFLAGIADSGRKDVPLLHRYWWASPDSIERIICPGYEAPIYVSVKFNGEHMYTDTRPHFLDPQWIDFPDYRRWLPNRRQPDEPVRGVVSHLAWIPKPLPPDSLPPKPGTRNLEPPPSTAYPYRVLWHLRNDTIHTYRWGDPDFVREVVKNCKQPWSAGYLMGEERTQRGIDDELTPEAGRHQTWTYHHERHWFRFLLWGRLGYDPTIPDERWIALFEHRYGQAVGKDLFVALKHASQIIPLVSRFHFNYMNGDWAPEWCAGSWNTGFGRGRNYRDGRDDFHDIIEFIFNHTIDDRILDIPEFVPTRVTAAEAYGPDALAASVEGAAQLARNAAAVARKSGVQGEAWTLCQELDALAWLGLYYAAKIEAAGHLMIHFAEHNKGARRRAGSRLEFASRAWRNLVERGGGLYRRAAEGSRAYARLAPRVERDIVIAQTAGSAPEELRKLGVLKRAKNRPRYDFNNPELRKLIAETLAPATQPLFFLDRVELSPKTCDILVLGREAWAFNALPAAKKARVLDAVEQGCALVVFFQNFPRFDASWLPGGIAGRDRDYGSFRWTDRDHRVALKLDPADLEDTALINDALTGYDKSWTCLTDPPGGLCIREHGEGLIVFCQLDVLGHRRERMARRLVHNVLRFAARGKPKEEVRLVLLDAGSDATVRMLRAANHPYRWIDDLALAP